MASWTRRLLPFRARAFCSQAPEFCDVKAGVVRCLPGGGARKQAPLVFVHGVCHGAWFWRGYQELCANAGYESYAVNLASMRLKAGSHLSQHAESVWGAISDNLVEAPVLVGHSLGGIVIQEMVQAPHLQGRDVRGMIMMASAPRRVYLENLRFFTALLSQCGLKTFKLMFNFASVTPDAQSMQQLFFLPTTQSTTILGGDDTLTMDAYYARLKKQDVALGLIDSFPGSTSYPEVPKLVVVPLEDLTIPVATQRRLAKLANADVMEILNMAHCLGDTGWEASIGAPMIEWLDKHF